MQASNQVRVEEPGGIRGRFRIAARIFRDAEVKLRTSASKDDTRPVLTGVFVSVEGRRARMVSTDSYRLTIKESDLVETPDGDMGGVLIPAGAMRHVSRMVRVREEVEVVVSGGEATFRLPEMTLSVRLIPGNFPEYRRLLPEDYEREFMVAREEVVAALKRIKPSRLRGLVAPVGLTFHEGSLQLLMHSEGRGEAREAAAAKIVKGGEGFAMGFNPAFLLDAFSAVSTEVVRIRCNGAMRPAMFTPCPARGEPDHQHLLMPMRLVGRG